MSGWYFHVADPQRSPRVPVVAIEEPPLPRPGRTRTGRDVVGRRRRRRRRRVDVGRIKVVGPPIDPLARDAVSRERRSRNAPDRVVLEALGEARVTELGGLGQEGCFVPTGEDFGAAVTGRQGDRRLDGRGPGCARPIDEAIAAVEAGPDRVGERAVVGERECSMARVGDEVRGRAALPRSRAVEHIVLEHAEGFDL